MNRYRFFKTFGLKPKLNTIILWSVQQALRGYGVKHPDCKRTRRAKLRDLDIERQRQIKLSQRN